ncbi:hypothetical protein C5Y96_15260 [Blastopirellula marina]|uniref:WD40 repeat domain-containing protein n=1 Tax=Blastopirellula marina TaxID=124 RepID=A0A2S8FAD4_9BACT|nr:MULTISPECIES: hypothetical protein [Pirellulaceae]PQO29111.1 hypothetical protein C5Y96_15260 [Blastopirellula marina]RCS50302.1 hypothetical protein DTL36_15270 [Bremerella cremea]
MRLPSFIAYAAIAFGLLAFSLPVSSYGQASQQPSAEDLAKLWDRLAHRQRPMQISKANEFDLSGPAISKTVVSRDGGTLLVLDQEGALVFWNLKTGEQISRIVPEQASPDAVLDIAYNGTSAVVGFPSGLIQVFVASRSKPLIEYKAYKTPLQMVQLSADQNRVIAVDGFGKSFEVDARGKSKGFEFGPSEDTPVKSLVAAGGGLQNWWKIYIDDNNQVSDVYFDGKEKLENNIELKPPHRIEASDVRFLLVGPEQLAWSQLAFQGENKYEASFSKVDFETPLRDAAFVFRKPWIWTLSDEQLELRSLAFGNVEKTVQLPEDLPAKHTYLVPNDEAMVTITPEGHVTRWNAYVDIGNPLNELVDMISIATINQRFDALELIAKKWNDRIDHFQDSEHETPYSFLMSIVQRVAPRLPGHEERPYKAFHDWIDNNPNNCQFTRIALFRLYLAAGYRARGEGFANTVTEEGWKTFYENMEKSWEVAEPLFDQDYIPAEGYTCAIIAGKNLQWDRDEINGYLRDAFAKYPTYHRTFTEEAVARLPRWGGKPGETEYLARFTADKIGGDDGDILYATLAQHISRYVGWDNIDVETGFSRERILKGLVAMTKTTENRRTIQQTLQVAIKWEDEEAARAAATRLVELMEIGREEPLPNRQEVIDKIYEQYKQREADKP